MAKRGRKPDEAAAVFYVNIPCFIVKEGGAFYARLKLLRGDPEQLDIVSTPFCGRGRTQLESVLALKNQIHGAI